jgi:hypothetical protein
VCLVFPCFGLVVIGTLLFSSKALGGITLLTDECSATLKHVKMSLEKTLLGAREVRMS